MALKGERDVYKESCDKISVTEDFIGNGAELASTQWIQHPHLHLHRFMICWRIAAPRSLGWTSGST